MIAQISDRARADLEQMYNSILSRQGSEQAEQFLGRAIEAVEFLVLNPEAGPHPCWRTRHKTIRFWVISRTNFLIFYFAENGRVSIERILDSRRDVKRIMNRRRENPKREG